MKIVFLYFLILFIPLTLLGCECPNITSQDSDRIKISRQNGDQTVYIKADGTDTFTFKIIRYEEVRGHKGFGRPTCTKNFGYRLDPIEKKDSMFRGNAEYSYDAPYNDTPEPKNMSFIVQFNCLALQLSLKKDSISGLFVLNQKPTKDTLVFGGKNYYQVIEGYGYPSPVCQISKIYYEFGKDVFAFYLDKDTIPYVLH